MFLTARHRGSSNTDPWAIVSNSPLDSISWVNGQKIFLPKQKIVKSNLFYFHQSIESVWGWSAERVIVLPSLPVK